MRKRSLILTITDEWIGSVRRVRLQGTGMLPLYAGERVTAITIPRQIPVRQLGLATGQVIFVRRLHGKSNPLKIEVTYYER